MRLLITLLLFLCFQTSNAQNLIYNPDFEAYDFCPWEFSQYFTVDFWSTPSKGTSDYYNNCEQATFPPTVKTPTNFFGHQSPKKGVAYSGIYCYYRDDYREYLQAQLKGTLVEGQRYRLQFHVSLADTAAVAIKELGVAFLDAPYKVKNWKPLELPFQTIKASSGEFIKDKKNWTTLSLDFTATGQENFFIIGNFKNNEATDTIFVGTQSPSSADSIAGYYYVDDVCLATIDEDNLCFCTNEGEPVVISDSNYLPIDAIEIGSETPNRPRIGDIVILENIYFDFDKAVLKPESEPELQKLYDLLIAYPTLKIIINGHTDSKGNNDYNLQLSEARALAVYANLRQKGIASNRIDFKGYGELKPIDSNVTDEGRSRNRRVEFEVIGE